MDLPLTKEESYAERRKLFKNIWETSMHIDEKDDIMNKPKIIKTLRLDEMDRSTADKKKKQRIKNLRAVCNKLLDFCDRQDADDLFYEQMASQGQEPLTHTVQPLPTIEKHLKGKRKVKKARSVLPSMNRKTTARETTSEITNDDKSKTAAKTSRNTSPIKIKRKYTALAPITMKSKQMQKISLQSDIISEVPKKKNMVKKRYKKKSLQITTLPQNTNDLKI